MRNLFVATLLLGTSLTMLQADAQEAKTAAPSDTMAAPVTANDLYREMRIQAGQYAAQNRHQVLVGDFTCDDINDQIVGWVDRDNPEGPFFDVLMVTYIPNSNRSRLRNRNNTPFASTINPPRRS